MKFIIAISLGYLLGSIPFALVIGKLFYHTDIRETGSGNLGGTNAGRVLGKKAGVAVTVLDAIKCIVAMAIMYLIDPSFLSIAGFGCALGHCYPVFANFKGGKGVATIMGYILGLVLFGVVPWYVFIGAIIVFFGVLKLCKFVSFSSMLAVATGVILTIISGAHYTVCLSLVLLLCFTTYRHKENIQRLRSGTERKVTWI